MTTLTPADQGAISSNVMRWGWYSIAVNLLLIALHGVVAFFSSSLAVTAELTHNFIDLASASVVVAGLKLAMHKARSFPYGLYKVENLVAVGLAIMIFATAYEVVRQAFLGSEPPLQVAWWMPLLLVATLAIPLVFSHFELRAAVAGNSPALIADAREYRVHVYTTALALAALLASWVEVRFDRVAAVIIAVAVVKTGATLLIDSLRVLLDASINADTLMEIRRTIESDPVVTEVKWITGRNAGRFRFVEAGVSLRGTDLAKAGAAVQRIETGVRAACPQVERVLLHVEPRTSDRLRYAVPLHDPSGTISEHFGEAPYFALVTVDSAIPAIVEQRVLTNPHETLEKRKGIRVAEWLAAEKVDVVLVKEDFSGKGPAFVFRDAGIELRQIDKATLAEAIPV